MDLDAGIALISLNEAKEYLKVSGSADDAILQTLINSVCGWVQRYVGRPLLQTSRVEYYDGDGGKELILRCRPVASVASVYIDGLRQFGAETLIASTNYYVQKGRGILKVFQLMNNWDRGDANIKVTYTAGYTSAIGTAESAGGLPHDIRLAIKRAIDHHWRTGYTHRKLDIASESVGEINTNFRTGELPADVKSILDPFRDLISSPHFSYAD